MRLNRSEGGGIFQRNRSDRPRGQSVRRMKEISFENEELRFRFLCQQGNAYFGGFRNETNLAPASPSRARRAGDHAPPHFLRKSLQNPAGQKRFHLGDVMKFDILINQKYDLPLHAILSPMQARPPPPASVSKTAHDSLDRRGERVSHLPMSGRSGMNPVDRTFHRCGDILVDRFRR